MSSRSSELTNSECLMGVQTRRKRLAILWATHSPLSPKCTLGVQAGDFTCMMVWMILGLLVLSLILLGILLQMPKQHQFIDCCGNEDPTAVIERLKAGADPNKAGAFGLTPLGVAIDNKRTEIMRILIDAGAEVCPKSAKTTPLHSAIQSSDLEVVRILVEAGADPNLKDKHGRSAFMEACTSLKPDIAQLLLDAGADVNLKAGHDGQRQEHLIVVVVAMCSHLHKPEELELLCKVITLLLDAGDSPNARSSEGTPLLGLALPQTQVLRLLTDKGAITDVAWDGIELKEVIASLLIQEP